jgi:hypothetical protein
VPRFPAAGVNRALLETSGSVVDLVQGVAEVVGWGVGGGDGLGAGLASIQRLTPGAANTIVRWASIDSHW